MPVVDSFRADDVEEWQIFAAGEIPPSKTELTPFERPALEPLTCPLWTLPSLGGSRTHPYQAPPAVVRRFIELLSRPGDLIVDPFAGHGTTLVEALRLGRQALGYEIDPENVAATDRRIANLRP
jgi:DNA modification methylase